MQAEPMTPVRWHAVKAVLATALELDPDERARYVNQACAGDRALAAEVERLLEADAMAGAGFLDQPPPLLDDEDEPGDPWVGRRIGAYRIVELLGAGGMGVVYRATRVDDAYQGEVAIKLVRDEPGCAFVDRFRTERQILADLNHPNIARLLDGGTAAEGIPYLVMELIAGTPITEYCHRFALAVDARLELFLTVCSAVDYAHRHLVVHRDIKPGNVLVTADGVPKLLDFGIARMLGGHAGELSGQTVAGAWPMTPAYASPEQLRGEAITTATDVYSLGLLLYELLTGAPAFDLGGKLPHDAVRILLEVDPQPPSTIVRRRAGVHTVEPAGKLCRRLSGDLDTIVLKAIRKDARDRYTSVQQLAADIRRHLDGRPIAARKDTLRYRAAKFVRRHVLGVAAAAAVLAAVTTAGAVAVRSAAIARAERVRAEARVDDLRQLARSNLFELHDAIQALPGSAPARNLLIQRTLQYLDHLQADGGANRDLQHELAVGYERIAQLEGNFSGPGIGDSRAALASYQKAEAIREPLVASRPDDVVELTALGGLLTNYSVTLQLVGHTAEAATAARRALAAYQRVARLRPGDPAAVTDAAMADTRLSAVIGGTGSSGSTREIAAAIDHDRGALETLARLRRADDDPHVQSAIEQVQMHLGFHLGEARNFDEATRVFDSVLSDEHARPVLGPADLALVYNYRGLTFDRAGDYARALAEYESELRLARSVADFAPGDLQAKINLAIAQGNVGIDTARLGRPSVGLPQIDAAIKIGERLLAANPAELFYADLLVVAYAYQAEILSSLGNQTAAAAKYEAALRTASRVSQADPQDLESPLSIAKIHAALGVVLGRAERYAQASKEIALAGDDAAALLRLRPDDPEAAYLAGLNRGNAASLSECAEGQPCRGAASLRLPCLVN